jgi:hypothetical protein
MTTRKTTRIDMHVHTRGSDGRGSPEDIVRYALRAKLDGLCLTDHHLTYTAESLDVARALRQAGLQVFHGCEYSTAWGHMLIYGVNVEDFQWGFYPDPRQVISDVNEVGGLCVPAHPFKGYRRTYGDRVKLLTGAAGIEAANGQCTYQNPTANKKAAYVAETHIFTPFGGSDAHDPRDVGLCYTLFQGWVDSEAELLKAMRRFKGAKAVTSKKLVQAALNARKPKKVKTADLLPGFDLDSYPENRQVSEHDSKFWSDSSGDWPEEDPGCTSH